MQIKNIANHSYKSYQPPKVSLIEKIPIDWKIKRLQFGASILNSNVDKKTSDDEKPIRLCNYIDVYYNDIINEHIDFMNGSATEDEIKKFKLTKGDVIITKDSESADDIGIPAYVENNFNDVVCGYHLAIIKPFKAQLNGKFLLYYLLSKIAKTNFELRANGVTRYGLSKDAIKTILVPYPEFGEQILIANFLDKKTSQIDQLIRQKEKLLILLAEKRTAIISLAVTKGLNRNVAMKDSGIDWLGKIPKHWEIKRLRFLIEINPVKSEVVLEEDDLVSFVPMDAIQEYGVLSLAQERELSEVYSGYTYFKENDVLVAKITPCFENGKGSIASGLTNQTGFGTTEVHVLRPQRGMNNEFLFYLTISDHFRKIGESWMYGAGGQKRVPELFLKDLLVPICSVKEQNQIAKWLSKKAKEINLLSNSIRGSITNLKEYREALITAAVTGQIDVTK